MSRPAKETDFMIDLPTVGRFRFGRETLGDHIAIQAAYVTLTNAQGGQDRYLDFIADALAHFQVLCVSAPAGWGQLAALDYNETMLNNLAVLYKELMERLKSFRDGAAQGSQAPGLGASENVPQLVPADL
ncbi:hypothetical protein [Methylovulum psychrotolerans]|uniref:Uncharacterized protein n=2 Tax=Methylovulum psychrotolerans TaxID=1704499 RepID=A0A2S5CQG5_9GAMM|nr:hypothetical protein [Methylovulum psychrotolerans]MBT9099962.1 hypothetical protein [Methylovulum psychrotolerans]POZ53061.1 hypothetical protein AADEFJLK_00070 [Methylovulum psychrotolerans]